MYRLVSHFYIVLQFQPPVVPQLEPQPQSWVLWSSPVLSVVLV